MAQVTRLGEPKSELAEQEHSGELQFQVLRSGWKRALPELFGRAAAAQLEQQRLGAVAHWCHKCWQR